MAFLAVWKDSATEASGAGVPKDEPGSRSDSSFGALLLAAASDEDHRCGKAGAGLQVADLEPIARDIRELPFKVAIVVED